MTKEWRQLVALLLGVPELVLSEDFVKIKVAVNVSDKAAKLGFRHHSNASVQHPVHISLHKLLQGVFNSESVWVDDPPALPPVSKTRVKSSPAAANSNFQKPVTPSPSSAPSFEGTQVPVMNHQN